MTKKNFIFDYHQYNFHSFKLLHMIILHVQSYTVHVQTQKPENPSGGPLGTTFLKEICDI